MWDARYEANPFFYGRMPNDFLVSAVGSIPKGKVLCLAEGEGRNSVFLARSGYAVTGVDFSDKAIVHAQSAARSNDVEVEYVQADLADFDLGENRWHGVVSIFCHLPEAMRRDLHRRVVRALRPGGVYVMESYAPEQVLLGTGGPKDPDMLLSLKQAREELEGLEFELGQQIERIIFEGIGHNGPSAVTQVIARKPE
jgi:SAM-dependent methyltransferase